jgi:nitrate/nitrite transport system ATP-binding protein
MPLLELNNISKGYGKGAARTDVLKGLNLSIRDGEFVAIVGYSGAGKTTLISLIAGLIQPDAGEVIAMGKRVTAPGPERGVVFQNYSLLPWLTVLENVLLAVTKVFPKESSAEHQKRALEALAKVNLSPAIHKKPSELSGGMRQRVAVARALAMNPQVLLLDEPLSALDALTRATIQDEIIRLWEADKKTVVLITNDVDEGLLMADRIIPLGAGPGAQLGPSFEVDIPRPRDRKALNHDPRFREVRTQVIEWLLGPGRNKKTATTLRPQTTATKIGAEMTDLTIGFVPLTDSAPFIAASEMGFFRKHGLNVKLKRFTNWPQITDALCNGDVQAAHLLFGIPTAVTAGLLGSSRKTLIAPWIASRNGQSITLSKAYERKVGADPAPLKALVDEANAAEQTPTLAMTFPLGTHAMFLRYWLGVGGIHPDVDVTLSVVPPPMMVAGLRSGSLAGLCVGEPWNAAAVEEQVGFTAITSQEIWRDHPEKVCGFTEEFAAANPHTVKAVLKALHEASVWLDEPKNRPAAAKMISPAHYVNCPTATIESRLLGHYDYGDGRRRDFGELAVAFSQRNANYPQLKYVIWWLTQFRRWGMLDAAPDYEGIARRVARFDLYQQAMTEIGHRHLGTDNAPEILFDGHTFDPADPEGYAHSFRINTIVDAEPTATSGRRKS